MRTVADLSKVVAGRLANQWEHLLTGTAPASSESGQPDEEAAASGPHLWSLSLGLPARTDLDATFTDVQRQARTWAALVAEPGSGLALTFTTRHVRTVPQRLPSHLLITDVNAAARLAADGWPHRLNASRARWQTLTSVFPSAATPAALRAAAMMSDADFALLCAAAHWFTSHDGTGLTPRQVPVPGLHGKWLNSHQALVAMLAGIPSLGLIGRPTRVHFTYLDPAHHAAGGRRHDSMTLNDAMKPPYPPTVALIMENKDTVVYFPTEPGWIAVEGNGKAGPTLLPRVPWLAAGPGGPRLLYWGDMDADGYEILDALRRSGLPVTSILMDGAAYTAYAEHGTWTDEKNRPLTCPTRRPLPHLTDAERTVYDMISDPYWDGPRRIEQERIPLTVAHTAAQDAAR